MYFIIKSYLLKDGFNDEKNNHITFNFIIMF